MINREATIRWKGYDPEDLKPNSRKRVWANCNKCGKGRWVYKFQYTDFCKSCSPVSDKTRKKMSESKNGEKNPMHGKKHTKEVCENAKKRWENVELRELESEREKKRWDDPILRVEQSIRAKKQWEMPGFHDSLSGENSPFWKGGQRETAKRQTAKRRKLGYIPLNYSFEKSEGHHITKNIVIHIPKTLHRSISHNIWTGKNMDKINNLALKFLIGGL